MGKFYIGTYGLKRSKSADILVYDWRAPVSSIFYDYEPGPASYLSPSGRINGELVLKRQYRIENGKLKLMFDSNITIEDNILQEKGLEFDVVVAAILTKEEYMHEENQLFYTVCTRALHKLKICSVEKAGSIEKYRLLND